MELKNAKDRMVSFAFSAVILEPNMVLKWKFRVI